MERLDLIPVLLDFDASGDRESDVGAMAVGREGQIVLIFVRDEFFNQEMGKRALDVADLDLLVHAFVDPLLARVEVLVDEDQIVLATLSKEHVGLHNQRSIGEFGRLLSEMAEIGLVGDHDGA